MVDIVRPEYGQGWASQGERVAPTEAKMESGWVQEMMPFQWENYLQGRQDDALLYLLQKGVPEYSPTQEYIANKSIVQYQTNLYLALATVTNVLPTVTASWKRLSPTIATNGTVPITGGGTGATTAAAARENLGLGDAATVNLPTTVGVVVKDAANTLVSRTIVGVAGDVTVTNPDGVAGNITVGVGSNVAKTNQDSSWTSKGGIRLPSGSTAERGVATAGRIRFNNTTGRFEGYNGTAWEDMGSVGTSLAIQEFATNGVQTTFPLVTIPVSKNNIFVSINGVLQHRSTYSINATSIVFSEAPTTGMCEITPITAAPYSADSAYVPVVIPDADEGTVVTTVNAVLSALRAAGITQ